MMPEKKHKVIIESDEIHQWFGLSYANYLVIQRSFLQSMPHQWQKRFVKCLEELWERIDAEIPSDELPDGYWVRAKKDRHFVKDHFSNYERGRRQVFKRPTPAERRGE